MNSQPMVLFFGLDDPCECMVELTGRAERQMKNWPIVKRDGLQVIRFAMDQRKDLEAKFNVFHAPSLLLVDAQGRVV